MWERVRVAAAVAVSVACLMVGGAAVASTMQDGGDVPKPERMRQYLVPADVTQEDAGTCWVETRDNGTGHIVCFAPGEQSRFRPYVREAVTESGETWTVR